MRSWLSWLVSGLVVLSVPACSLSRSALGSRPIDASTDAQAMDAPLDAGRDAGDAALADTGLDAGTPDMGLPDSGADANLPDVGTDAGSDANVGPVDAGSDAPDQGGV